MPAAIFRGETTAPWIVFGYTVEPVTFGLCATAAPDVLQHEPRSALTRSIGTPPEEIVECIKKWQPG